MEGDEGVTPCLTCHVELDLGGPNYPTIFKWTADALRLLADRIEKGEFEDGSYPVPDATGKKIGEVYFDHYGYEEF